MNKRTPIVQTRRDAWVEINLGAIENNILELKKTLKTNTKILAVVKADAYGHDATMVAPTLIASGVNMFGVASIDEGLQLRESGINIPILVLGSAPDWGFESAIENNIALSIFTKDHILSAKEAFKKTRKPLLAHIKIDTGMHRIGLPYNEALEFIQIVQNEPAIDFQGIFSHFACAENREKTKIQLENWENILSEIDTTNLICHISNTAGIMAYDGIEYNMVRAGIGIYGLYPDLPDENVKKMDLIPAMSLKGRIANIQILPKNVGISYGHTFVTKNDNTKIATVPIGYADGIPRALSNKINGILKGQKISQVGNITMDQMMFDITNIQNVEIGDVITLIGSDEDKKIYIDEWAKLLNTINYEITCRLKSRLPRVFTR